MSGIIIFDNSSVLECSTIKCEIYNITVTIDDVVIFISHSYGTLCWCDGNVQWLKIKHNENNIYLDNNENKNMIPNEILSQAIEFMSDETNYKKSQINNCLC